METKAKQQMTDQLVNLTKKNHIINSQIGLNNMGKMLHGAIILEDWNCRYILYNLDGSCAIFGAISE